MRSSPDRRSVPTRALVQRDKELIERVRLRRRVLLGTAAAQLLVASAAAVWFLQRPGSGSFRHKLVRSSFIPHAQRHM